MSPKICPNCQKIITNKRSTYCSSHCFATYTQKDGGHHKWSEEGKKKLSEWAKKNNTIKFISIRGQKPKVELIKKNCLNCNIEFTTLPNIHDANKKYCSKQCYINHAKSGAYKGRSGGYRIGAGRGKHGWYKGYYCDSSWELAWVIYQLDHNILFKRNTKKFPYIFEGQSYSYIPDFILSNGEYVEIKGWPNKKTESKLSQFPHKLTILWKPDMENIIDYVKQTYGRDFIKLYEGNPHNEKKNKCKFCGKPAKKYFCSGYCAGKMRWYR